MNAMTAARTAQLHQWRVPLAAGPAAAAEARKQVRAAIWAWDVPVDTDVAVLLVCELVTNAIMHTASEAVTLAIVAAEGGLRVDVHDASPCLPVPPDASLLGGAVPPEASMVGVPSGGLGGVVPPEDSMVGVPSGGQDSSALAETGRGLQLVAALSNEWGFYRTPAGKAVYFTLGFQPGR